MMFGNSLRMLCLFILICLLLPHQILSKTVPLAEWMKQGIAKVGHKEFVKELEFYAAVRQMINEMDTYEKFARLELWRRNVTKDRAVQLLQDKARAGAIVLRLLATVLDVHSPLLTIQQFKEIAKKIINKRIPNLREPDRPRGRGHPILS